MTEQGLVTRQESALMRQKNYIMSPEVKQRFQEMMGKGSLYYLNQVLSLVANNDRLQQCTPMSIVFSALRAASLHLDLDPALGQAWIVPYGKEAQFQIGYRGLRELALRTNQYRFLHVGKVYEGETVEEDRMTGIQKVTGEIKDKSKIIGWMFFEELFSGYRATFYMSVDEIEQHAKYYSRAYQYDLREHKHTTPWSSDRVEERQKMEMKTVLLAGLRQYGRLNADDADIIEKATDEDWRPGGELPDEEDVTLIPAKEKKTTSQINEELGFGPDPVKTTPAVDPQPTPVEEIPEVIPDPTPAIPLDVQGAMARQVTYHDKPLLLGNATNDELEAILSFYRSKPTLTDKQIKTCDDIKLIKDYLAEKSA
jgi:recombination protein RecT